MKTWLAAFAMIALSTAMPAAQKAQLSLGDLSRQVEGERASGRKSAKSYTNKDLTADPNARKEAAEPAATEGDVSASAGPKVSADEPVKRDEDKAASTAGASMPEAHWRQRADYLRGEYVRAQERQQKLRSTPQPASLPARARLEQEFTMVRQMVTGLNKQWDRLDESARQARIPMDWIGERPVFEQ
jgi:hypothetical protein